MSIGSNVGKDFLLDERFAQVMLDLIDGIVTACDAAAEDADLEPDEDCCGADEDIGSVPVFLPWFQSGCMHDFDDAEPNGDDEDAPAPGFMNRNGVWRGTTIPFLLN